MGTGVVKDSRPFLSNPVMNYLRPQPHVMAPVHVPAYFPLLTRIPGKIIPQKVLQKEKKKRSLTSRAQNQ